MKRSATMLTTLALTVVVTGEASAQWNVARFETQRNRVYATVGVDPAALTTIGYGRVLTMRGHDLQVTADAGIVVGGVDAQDFRARIGVVTSIVQARSVQLTGSATFITRGTENVIYRGLNLGADVTGALGVYRPGWFVAGEFGKDKAIITHVTHSDWYRENHFADAKDGWYLDTGGTFHYDVAAGITLGRAELLGRFGLRRTENFRDVAQPIYGSLGIGFGF